MPRQTAAQSLIFVLAGFAPVLLAGDRKEPAPPNTVTARRNLRALCLQVASPRQRTVTFVHTVKNRAATPVKRLEVVIAVPRSDERQTVHAVRFAPEPSRRGTDAWDQETALFLLDEVPPGGESEVQVTAEVTLHDIEWLITERDLGGADEVPDRVARQYLRNGENYRLEDPVLRREAERIQSSGAGQLEKLRRIHDLVVDNLEYDRDERWDSADRVLRQGTGSCSEYTYLMIALCRLNGIAARYAGGTWVEDPEELEARVHVDRVFHRWVEVYLPRVGWFPIDPTRDDAAEKAGAPYRYFGRLPWNYLTMTRGDGDRLESGLLGWDYRSGARWLGSAGAGAREVDVERYAIWRAKEEAGG